MTSQGIKFQRGRISMDRSGENSNGGMSLTEPHKQAVTVIM